MKQIMRLKTTDSQYCAHSHIRPPCIYNRPILFVPHVQFCTVNARVFKVKSLSWALGTFRATAVPHIVSPSSRSLWCQIRNITVISMWTWTIQWMKISAQFGKWHLKRVNIHLIYPLCFSVIGPNEGVKKTNFQNINQFQTLLHRSFASIRNFGGDFFLRMTDYCATHSTW